MATAGTDNQKIVVMTVNIGLKPRDGPKQREKTRKIKNDAIAKLLEAQQPSIVFLQENRESDNIPTNFEILFEEKASLLYDKTKLKLELQDKSTFEEKESKVDASIELYKSRFCVATAKPLQEQNAKFLCVSWHGPNTNVDKEKALEIMLSFVDKMCMKLNLPCIIGGDFNVSCEKVISYLNESKLESKFICSQCVIRPRRTRVIDFFVTSKSLEVTGVTAVDWNSLRNIDENLDDYFDHDPIVGSILETSNKSNEDSQDTNEGEDYQDSAEDEDSQETDEDETILSLVWNR